MTSKHFFYHISFQAQSSFESLQSTKHNYSFLNVPMSPTTQNLDFEKCNDVSYGVNRQIAIYLWYDQRQSGDLAQEVGLDEAVWEHGC